MHPRTPRRLVWLLLALTACGDGIPPIDPNAASFELIQSQILEPKCVSCHTAGHSYAKESGLVLDAKVAYDNMVGTQPKNRNALADGLLQVMPGRSDRSLFYHKLHWEDEHHGHDYGNPMPLGGQSLSVGQIEFVRAWIDAGAPRTGQVADPKLLEDRTRPDRAPFTPLAPPAQGYQLRIEQFPVRPNFERELFVYRRVGNASEVFVNRIETKMRPNSHHFLLYTFPPTTPAFAVPAFDVIRDIRNPDGTENFLEIARIQVHVFFAGAMTQTSDYRFPDGVALRLPAGAALDLNSHYVNKGSTEIPGEAYANLHTIPASQVKQVVTTLNLQNNSITLPAGQRTTLTRTFRAGTDIPLGADSTAKVLTLTSHMHARGERFVIRITGGSRDGEVVYENTDWASPVIRTFAAPIVLRRGEGLTSVVTYNNTTGRTIQFGLTSDDEMDIIFGYAY